MKNKTAIISIASLLVVGLLATGVVAFGVGPGDGDGILQERDADNDGVLNCNDEDYVPPEDGTGYGAQANKGNGDQLKDGIWNGDGPHDEFGQKQGQRKGRH